MANTRDSLGHVFTVNQVTIQATPVTHNVVGPLDNLGQLVDLARLDGETFKSYKHRVLDTYVHRANATYRGLINGITRELGLLQYDAMTIRTKNASDGPPEAPRITIDNSEVILYNKWKGENDYEIDKIINIYNRSGNDYNGYYYEDLISEINSSTYFVATLGVNIDPHTRSNTLITQSSDYSVSSELVPSATNFKLAYTDIVENTIFFDETSIFKTIKETEAEVISNGDYYINYQTGRVVVKTLPSGSGTVRYISQRIPFIAEASPVFLVDFKNDKFKKEIFEQIVTYTGGLVNGKPKPEAIDIINELFSIKGMYWGV